VTADDSVYSALRSALPGTSDDDLAAVAACGESIVYRPGDALFAQDEASVYCHLVLRGVVELFRAAERERVITRLGSGRFVGDIALFLDVPYLSSARAGTYAEIRWFHRDPLLEVVRSRPAVAFAWLLSAMATSAEAHDRLDVVMAKTARQQVAGALFEASEAGARVALSQAEMAAMLGIGRQTINRVLGELMDEGLVRTGYGFVEILDRAGLSRLFADGP
jgi:CRP/FNR family cyclic AMP-dependent transcriptional regulator